ncbi:MAG: site-specific DNA-methyltransferase [Butyrivibrio sp.]|nr:site-specific DNA-methyltransferase [Butyrivibrio sp.]MBR1642103.1 site-specific DNA-methyltransferase [Butyrivibrio sp.]
MSNLSQIKRQHMMEFLNKIKDEHKDDDEMLIALGEIENELNSKKYGLVWEQHEEAVDIKMRSHIPVFTEVKEKEISLCEGEKYNFLLEGDNLHSLRLLEKTHSENIDVIYIDPPYNTGKEDFMYDDKFVDEEDGFRHSKWASFMNERLQIARNLLRDTGFIAISIDDNEYAVLKILCDDIFGPTNYLTTFHVQVRYPDKNVSTEDKVFKPLMEYILFYAKDSSKISINQEEEDYGLEKFCYKITEKAEGTKFSVGNQEVIVYKKGEWDIEKIDGCLDGLKETWVTGSIYTTMSYGKVFQTVVEPRVDIDGLGCLYKVLGRGDDGLGYRYYTGPQRSTAKKGKMYSGVPLEKAEIFKNGLAPKKKIPIVTTYDFSPDFGNIRHEGGVPFGSGKKPVKMLKQIINYCGKKDAIVLDFFAGSGSTGHATLDLNNDDGGNRTFILCTNNQNKICEEITYPRLSNTIKGFGNTGGIAANLMYYKTDFVAKENESVSDALLEHIAEMIQLEYRVKIDGQNYILILDDEQADNLASNWEKYKDAKAMYVSRDVLFTTEQNKLFMSKDIYVIPDYYFNFELREVGESW